MNFGKRMTSNIILCTYKDAYQYQTYTQATQLAYEAHTVLIPGVKSAFVYFYLLLQQCMMKASQQHDYCW